MYVTQLRHQIRDPLYRNSLLLMTTTAVTSGLGFFFWMVVARYYTEYEVGVAAAIISAVSVLALISSLGLNVALMRFLAKAKKPVEMINSFFTINVLIALAVSGIFIAGLDLWSPAIAFIKYDWEFVLAFLLFSVCWPLSGIIGAVFVANRRAEFVLAKDTIFSLLKIPLPIILSLFFHSFGIVTSWGIAISIALAISFLLFLPRVQKSYKPVPTLNLGIIKEVWKYSAGNYFALMFGAVPALILPIMVVNVLSGEQNAYFYIASMMSGLLLAIPAAISQSLFAEGSHSEEELAVNARRAFKFIFLLLVPAIILLIALGKWLLLLFGESYSSNALTLLWILSLSSLFAGVNSVYFTILRVRGRIKELIIIRVFITLAVLVTSGLTISTLGIESIGYVFIGSRALVSIYVLLRIRARFRTDRLGTAASDSAQ